MIKDDFIHLVFIQENVDYALDFTRNLSKEDFFADQMVKLACIKCLETIGEATKNLSDHLRKRYPEIDWKAAMGMRDRLAHDYMGIDYHIIWETITKVLPGLKKQLEVIIAEIRP